MKCTYCTAEIEQGTGFIFVKKTGVIRYYCSKRCYRLNVLQNRKYRENE
ncbi:MAG: hypothetical protein M1156_01095 [Candidatus Marsarchaeota archaeon]|nr:hypothetical protein [Candidatus Marsarchaeota archaeon]